MMVTLHSIHCSELCNITEFDARTVRFIMLHK